MDSRTGLEMTVEGLIQYCENKNYLPDEKSKKMVYAMRNDFMPKFTLELQDKNLMNLWKNCFETAINEIQSDEEALLYFVGMHKFKSLSINLGCYAYMLTNRRLIMSGIASDMSDILNPVKFCKGFRVLKEKYGCKVQSLYLNDLAGVTLDMIKGYDVLKVHTNKETFDIAVFNKNVSHKLCKEIQEALNNLRR